MAFFKKLMGLWRVRGNERLRKLKNDIKDNITLIETIKPLISEKISLIEREKSSLVLIRKMGRINKKLERILSHVLGEEKKVEKIELRRLFKMSSMITGTAKHKITTHLRYVYNELIKIENDVLNLKKRFENENRKLEEAKKGKFNWSRIKKELNEDMAEQQASIQNIENALTQIDHQLNEKLLMDYFGGKTRFKCPRCNMNFVKVEKTQIRAQPRLHSHTFTCYFCSNIEEADDTKLAQVQKKWS